MNRATVVLLAFLFAARGHAADIVLTASTGTGVIYGVARELVYNTYNNQPYTESELDWGLQPLFITKATLSMRTSVGFAASLDLQLGVPWKTGSVSDSDWLNYNYNGDPTKTNYSLQNCYTERAILLDARVGWELPFTGWLILEPFLAFGFMDFNWTARDGYLQYPPGYPSVGPPYPAASTQPQIPISGTIIIYHQTYYIPAAGLEARIGSRNTGVSVSFEVSPFVFCNDTDNHELATKDYYDTMANGLLLEPKLALWWQMGSARFYLDVSYRHIGGLIGDSSVVLTGIGHVPGQVAKTYPNGAGASYDAMNVSVDFSWTL